MYRLTDKCPNPVILQDLKEGGLYDYSEGETFEGALAQEKRENPHIFVPEGGQTVESIEREFLDSLTEFDPEEVLSAAGVGFGWPLDFGFVEKIESK